jgi:multiple sugar transport system substrate-binding protein
MADLGVSVPAGLQLSPDAFLDMIKKAKAKSITPMALGVGDRPYPGAHLVHEALLKRLGVDEYGKLLAGKLPWTDPRVVDTLKWVKGLTEAGLLPATFTTLKLAEAHGYFHTNPGALTFLNGSWYTSRAFNPVDRRTADGFPARHHAVSGSPGAVCNECRSSRSAAATSPMPRPSIEAEVTAFFTSFCRPRWATAG